MTENTSKRNLFHRFLCCKGSKSNTKLIKPKPAQLSPVEEIVNDEEKEVKEISPPEPSIQRKNSTNVKQRKDSASKRKSAHISRDTHS